jgi:Fe-S-cluster-containing dehydrogenase component
MAKQLAMVIDLLKCVGCGACSLACKTENNTQMKARGQTFKWADFYMKSEGKFPDVKYTALPVRCNHCSEPKCIEPCPEPKALYKTEEGITMFNYKYCIQCKKCLKECPYSSENAEKEGVQYSVISWNEVGVKTHDFYQDKTELIKGCTSSPAEVAAKAVPPHKHAYVFRDDRPPEKGQKSRGRGELADVRSDGWVDKCHFCIHRIREGLEPYCVASCPSKARIVGDINDPNSEASQLIKKYKPMRLKNNKGEFLKDGEAGTKPNMYYIRSYSARK